MLIQAGAIRETDGRDITGLTEEGQRAQPWACRRLPEAEDTWALKGKCISALWLL